MLDDFEYRTPESLTISAPVAGIGSRGLAALVDSVLIGLIILALLAGAAATSRFTLTVAPSGGAVIALVVVASVVPVAYYVIAELTSSGRSVGKAIFGLRVVDLGGIPIGASDSLVRNLIRIVDFLPFLYAIGVITMFAGRQPRRLGDLVAGTVVIRDPRMDQLAPPPKPLTGPGWPGLVPNPELLSGLDRAGKFELALIEDFLSRPGLTSTRRRQVARQVLEALRVRSNLPGPGPSEDPVVHLQRIRDALRLRLSGPGSPPADPRPPGS